MKTEFELKLQAGLDGELPAHEAGAVEAQAEHSPEAKALRAELQFVRSLVRGNELERPVPETREFYWSRIERAILAAENAGARRPSPLRLAWLSHWWPQLSGATVAALLLLVTAVQFNWLSRPAWADIENPLDETGTFSFRSEQQRMTLVWVSNPATPDEEEDADSVN